MAKLQAQSEFETELNLDVDSKGAPMRAFERRASYGSDLRTRTMDFALCIVTLYSDLPRSSLAQTLGKQLVRSGTSVGANYCEACRARTDAELISKLHIALQELEETRYWLELLSRSKVTPKAQTEPALQEVRELISMFVVGVNKIKARPTKRSSK